MTFCADTVLRHLMLYGTMAWLGDWRSGSALPSHGRGHWFDPSIAHHTSRIGPKPRIGNERLGTARLEGRTDASNRQRNRGYACLTPPDTSVTG